MKDLQLVKLLYSCCFFYFLCMCTKSVCILEMLEDVCRLHISQDCIPFINSEPTQCPVTDIVAVHKQIIWILHTVCVSV